MNLLITLFLASQQDKRIQLKIKNLATRQLLLDIAGTLPEVWKAEGELFDGILFGNFIFGI